MRFGQLMVLGLLSFSAISLSAEETVSQRLHIECKGYIDNKITVLIESSMVPNEPRTAVTNLELGVVLKTWEQKNFPQYDDEMSVTGGDVAIEGNVGGGQGLYKYKLPWFDGYQLTERQQHFYTGLTLKTSVISGKVTLNCKASLRNLKTQIQN